MECPLFELLMERNNYRNILLGMMQKDVAASLMVDYESGTAKSLDKLSPRKSPAHGKTSTSRRAMPGFPLISFSFSSPSR